jgi:predicted RNase H-like HicB family nuclease
MEQHLSFYLTVVYEQDEKTGDITASFAQFPEAASQGRTQSEATKLLYEIFPYLMQTKKDEFLKYHPATSNMTFAEQKVQA